jgi:hypothetical protein
MRVFEAPSPNAQARGAAIQSIVEGVPSVFEDKARRILAKNGIEEIAVDEWYSMQSYLDAYETVVDEVGDQTLQNIGATTPETAEWPPGVETPFEALSSIDDAYQLNHRGGDVGHYEAERIDETTARVECHTPYHSRYEQALVKSTAALFADGLVSIREVDSSNGGARCTFEVSW